MGNKKFNAGDNPVMDWHPHSGERRNSDFMLLNIRERE